MAAGCLTALGMRVVLLACLLVSATTVVGSWRNLWFAFSGVVAEGTVVRQVEELAADWNDSATVTRTEGVQMAPARRLFRAIVEFQDSGRAYQVQAQALGPVHIYALGSHVDVVYSAGRPATAKLKPELPDFWTQAGFLLMGTMLGAGAVYWWWKLTRRHGRINPLPDGRSDVLGG